METNSPLTEVLHLVGVDGDELTLNRGLVLGTGSWKQTHS